MRVRLVRGPWWAAAAACFTAFAVGSAAGCEAGRAASDPAAVSAPASARADGTVRVLQMNLCNSGRADCYSGGRAISRAAALIHEHRPDLVSLNEICHDDLAVLERAMSTTLATGSVASAFGHVNDRDTGAPVRCRNGEDFGDGVLVVVPPTVGSRTYGGANPVQSPRDPEERIWACIDVPARRFAACTTHSTSADATTALAQCGRLLKTVFPGLGRPDGLAPLVLGADLNLPARGPDSPDACLPDGYQRADDGGLQHVVVGPGLEVRSRSVIDMQGTTDHPGLLVDVALPRG
ncbi:endonuclease/exonuclease/phosphatase family protein [Terrabacter sp. AAH1]